MSQKKIKDPFAGNLFANGVLQFFHYVFPIVTLPYVGSVVGSESFGIINYFSVLVGYFTLVVIYGFDFSGTRKVAQLQDDPVQLKKYFLQVQSTKLFLLVISGILYGCLLPFLPEGPNHEKIAWATFGVTAGWALMPNWFVQGMRAMRSLIWLNVAPKVLFIGIVFILIQTPKDAFIYPLSISLSSIAVAVISLLWVHHRFHIPYRYRFEKAIFTLLHSERWVFLSGLINNTNQTFNVLILGYFVAFESVGHFTLGWRLMNVTQVLVMFPIMQSLFPVIGEKIKAKGDVGLRYLNRSIPLVFAAIMVSVTVMYGVGPWIISHLFGQEYLPAIQVLHVLLLVPFITAASHLIGNVALLNLNKDRKVFIVIGVTALFSITLNIGLIQWQGVKGAIAALILSELFALTFYLLILKKEKIQFLSPTQWLPKKMIIPLPETFDLPEVMRDHLTLVIPTYNRLDVWDDLLCTLQGQTIAPSKVIVVDQSVKALFQNLQDKCLQALPNWHWEFIHLETPNRCKAKDFGIHQAEDGVVIVIDDDLWLPKDFLAYYKNHLTLHPHHVLTTRIIEVDRPLLKTRKVQRYTWFGHFYNNNYSLQDAQDLISVTGACFGFYVDSTVRHIAFEPRFIGTGIMEEPDLAIQLLRAGREIVYKADATVVHFPQKDGNDEAKRQNAVQWYGDSFFNFGFYHAKHGLKVLHWLRLPYISFLSIHVVFNRFKKRTTGSEAIQGIRRLIHQYFKGYAAFH